MAQMGCLDLSDRYASLDGKKDPLVEIDAVVPWEEFRPSLEELCMNFVMGFERAVDRGLCSKPAGTSKGAIRL